MGYARKQPEVSQEQSRKPSWSPFAEKEAGLAEYFTVARSIVIEIPFTHLTSPVSSISFRHSPPGPAPPMRYWGEFPYLSDSRPNKCECVRVVNVVNDHTTAAAISDTSCRR